MKKFISRLLKEEDGQGMTEYGMIVGFIAVVAIIVMVLFRTEITELFTDVTDEMDEVPFEDN